jgi:hypothetical protein
MNSKTTRTGRVQEGERANGPWKWLRMHGPSLIVVVFFLLSAARMFQLISFYAVNVFFSDQWEFNDATLFQKHSLWQMFAWQHGPHRQGLGALFAKLVDPPLQWNSRIESFIVGGVVVVAAICVLWLKKRLYGSLSVCDIAIPAILFTPAQWETLVLTPNFAHGSFPLLLVALYCLAWTIKRAGVKYPLVLFINFVTIYTGFGLFLGILTPILLLLDYWTSSARVGLTRAQLVGALLVSLASLASFFVGYKFNADLDCFSFEPKSPLSYLMYVALMCSNVLAVRGVGVVPQAVGLAILILLLAAACLAARRLLRRQDLGPEGDERKKSLIPLTLISYVLLFCAGTAYGRLCGGLGNAQSSRYVIYLELGLLGLYFQLLDSRSPKRNVLLAGLLASVVAASTVADSARMNYFRQVKQEWKACYIRTESIEGCNRFVGFPIFSHAPERTHLQEKLQYLKETGQNLYLDVK